MKNFYEATVIKPKLMLEVCLILKITHTPVFGMFKLNGKSVFGDDPGKQTLLTSNQHLSFQLPLTESIDINIQLIDRQHPNAVEIELIIDGHKILPKYQHLACPQTCYIDSNNVWLFKIDNFYPWLHEQTGQGWIA